MHCDLSGSQQVNSSEVITDVPCWAVSNIFCNCRLYQVTHQCIEPGVLESGAAPNFKTAESVQLYHDA
jgi:hypothetical protein